MTTQESNWELMSWLGMQWSEANKLKDVDRQFLIARCEEVKEQHKVQQQEQEKMQQEQEKMYQQHLAQQQGPPQQPSPVDGPALEHLPAL